MSGERCPDCDRPDATQEQFDTHRDGCECPECLAVCWRRWSHGVCIGPSVDWRGRALAAESARDEARALKVPPTVDELLAARMAAAVAEKERDAALAAKERAEADAAALVGALRFVADEPKYPAVIGGGYPLPEIPGEVCETARNALAAHGTAGAALLGELHRLRGWKEGALEGAEVMRRELAEARAAVERVRGEALEEAAHTVEDVLNTGLLAPPAVRRAAAAIRSLAAPAPSSAHEKGPTNG